MSDECIIQEETLTDMADAIREGFDITDKITADIMPNYIRLLSAPSYVKTEAERVVAQVKSHQNNNTFTFIAVSDSHYLATNANIVNGIIHAGQAMYYIRKGLDVDFVVNLGDNSWGSGISGSETTIEVGINEIKSVNKNIALGFADLPNFRTPGNHDNLAYNYAFNGNDYLDAEEIFSFFGAYNTGATFQAGQESRGYCYQDFDQFKLRVIVMNTCDIQDLDPANGESMYTSGTQMKWFAETIDLSGKSNASEWSFIVFSHHPLDFGISINCNKILKAYFEGTSVSFTRDGVTISYNYSGKNAATFIGNVHGHNHNFLVDKLRWLVSGSTTQPLESARRMCVPNACYLRSNERGQNGTTDVFDIEFGETTTYNKTAGTANDTAFYVVTVDPVQEIMYLDHYGAGYSQIVNYTLRNYSIASTLTNATSSNTATSAEGNTQYKTTITAKSGYVIKSVKVVMGGVDITSSVYSNGVINIPKVTGNITITVVGGREYTNQVPISEDAAGTGIYNGIGYKNGIYLSSSGGTSYDGKDAAYTATGWIPYKVKSDGTFPSIYIKGLDWVAESHSRLFFYYLNNGVKNMIYGTSNNLYVTGTNGNLEKLFTLTDLGDKYWKLTPTSTMNGMDTAISSPITWLRFSLKGTGANLIVTIDEPIE